MSRPAVFLEKQVTDVLGIDLGLYLFGLRLDTSNYFSSASYNVVTSEGQLLSKQPSLDRAREWAEDNGYILVVDSEAWSYEDS